VTLAALCAAMPPGQAKSQTIRLELQSFDKDGLAARKTLRLQRAQEPETDWLEPKEPAKK
jgi:hypothetical protein